MADKAASAPESAVEPHSVEAAALAIAKLGPVVTDNPKPAKAPKPKPAVPAEVVADDLTEEETPESVESETVESETPLEDDEVENPGDAEETDEGEVPAPRKFKVKVKDGDKDVETEVDEPELLKGYQRQQDYTRKTQSLAEERKKFAPEVESVRAERARLAERFTTLEDVIKSATPPEPDWAKARAELTAEDFAALRADWDIHKERMGKIKAEADAARAKVEDDRLERLSEHMEQQKALLLKAIPSWEKPEVAKVEKTEMADYALSEYGFTAEDMNAVMDHRVLLILRKAMKYDKRVREDAARLKAGKDKLAAAATVTPKPGVPKAPEAKLKKAFAASRSRLRETGSVNDAADTIKKLGLE